jgi:hypothetical protein
MPVGSHRNAPIELVARVDRGRGARLPGTHGIHDLLFNCARPDLPPYRLGSMGAMVNRIPDRRCRGTWSPGSPCRFFPGSCRGLCYRLHRAELESGSGRQYPVVHAPTHPKCESMPDHTRSCVFVIHRDGLRDLRQESPSVRGALYLNI